METKKGLIAIILNTMDDNRAIIIRLIVGFNGLVFYAPVTNGLGYSEVITSISSKFYRLL
jgi:hypothetical protein